MNCSENSVWNSIQYLKQKLNTDKIQLQNIRNQLHRSKSPISKKKQNSNKENDSYISNSSYYRSSLGGNKQQLELKKQHRKQISEAIKNYEDKLRRIAQQYELEIQRLTQHYESTIAQKDSYIHLLQTSIPQQDQCQQTPRTARLNELHQIKDHYQRIIHQAKNKYQQVICILSQQNNSMKQQILKLKDNTFKKYDNLSNCARQTLTKYMHSDVEESSRDLFSTSHINYDSNNFNCNRMNGSVIDNSERLSAIFKNKFKFNKNEQLIRQSSAVSIDVQEQIPDDDTIWRERSIAQQTPITAVHGKKMKLTIQIDNN